MYHLLGEHADEITAQAWGDINRMSMKVEDYLALPYTFTIRKDRRDDIFVARIAEIPRCAAHGETQQEALDNLHDSLRSWIEDCLESGDIIPVPDER